MKIGVWSDSINFPSLPLMKLSAYHKSLGDNVQFVEPDGHYDKVYLSKVFNLPLIKRIPQVPPPFYADEVEKGGTGYAIKIENGKEVFHKELHKNLSPEIENLCPDYSLYPQFSEAYGFLTRGCCNSCSFCIVTPKEGRCSKRVADLADFWKGQKVIKLLDPNILACTEREELLEQLLASKSLIDFTQGLDARFLTEHIVKTLLQMRVKAVHFAFDFMKNESQIIKGFECFNRYYTRSKWNVKCYILTNYDTTHEEDWYRVCKVRENDLLPDIRIYQKGTHDRFLTDLQRWCNNPRIFRSTEFSDYVPRKDGKSCRELYPNIISTKGRYFMPSTKTSTPSSKTGKNETMNIYQKLVKIREEFAGSQVGKSGVNDHGEFLYFELKDIKPVIDPILRMYHTLFLVTFPSGVAKGTLYNLDAREDQITFEFDMAHIKEPAKFRMNEAQACGAEQTYYRRYLYYLLLDIAPNDEFDGAPKAPAAPVPAPPVTLPTQKKPATSAERSQVKKTLTDADGNADKLQIKALKEALKALREVDPSQDEFFQEIALKTDSFTKIKRSACEQLIVTVQEMREQYLSENEG